MTETDQPTNDPSRPEAAPPNPPWDAGIYRENYALLGRYRLGRLLHRLFYDDEYLLRLTAEEKRQLADLQTDVTRAETDLDTQTQTVAALKGTVGNVVTLVGGLKDEITALKNQGVDTTGLEAKLTEFEQSNQDLAAANQTLAGLLPAAQAS